MSAKSGPEKYCRIRFNIGDGFNLAITEKDGIKEECKQLWRMHGEYIRSFCRFQLKDMPDYVEDCVQEVFMALLEAKRAGTEIQNPKAWLTAVANNKIKNEYKSRKRDAERINKIIRYESAADFSTLEMHDFAEVPDEVITVLKDNVLSRLKAEELALVEDFYVKHIKIKDIASKLGISETNVKQRLFRARKKIMHLSNEEIEKHKF